MIRLPRIGVAVAGLALCASPLPAAADDAAGVTDRMSLEAFVQDARAEVLAADPADRDALHDFADMTFRPMGAWRDGPIYVYILLTDGTVVFHGGDQSLEGVSLWDRKDLNDTLYAQELVAAARMGGGFVTYWFDNPDVADDDTVGSPKVSYVADLFQVDGVDYLIGSGIYPGADPEVTAREVESSMSNSVLQAFVEGARDATEILDAMNDDIAYNFFDTQFRPAGDWRHRSIYVFVLTDAGVIFFNGGNESLEGQNLWDDEDLNGTLFVQELISQAQMGGGFVEYYFDNPDVTGDEVDGSLKTSFATLVSNPSGTDWIIGSGYYPAEEVPVAPPLAYALLAALLAGAGYLRRRLR